MSEPGRGDALHLLGVAAFQAGNYEEAADLIGQAIEASPRNAPFHSNRGLALTRLGRFDAAAISYASAIELDPDLVDAHYNLGVLYQELSDPAAAVACYDRAIAIRPDHADAWDNRGVALQSMDQFTAAAASHEQALKLKPRHVQAHNNLAVALQSLGRFEDAIASTDRALALKPDFAEAFYNRGVAQQGLRQLDAALVSYAHAITARPGYAEAYNNRGVALLELQRVEDAVECFERAIALQPKYPYVFGQFLHAKAKLCDWSGFGQDLAELRNRLAREEKVTPGFPVLAMIDSPALHRKAAEIWVRDKFGPGQAGPVFPGAKDREKIRIGYFSADFYNHATTYLMAGLLEAHDRSRFELVAFSFGFGGMDAMRHRASAAFDRFLDVREMSDAEIAAKSRELGIDIAVDLKGYTGGGRMGIFAARAAPIQVNYLGYPGTAGAPFIDYLIADEIVIPGDWRHHYSEKIAYLPDTYQPNDSARPVSDRRYNRQELGLPDSGFVFCSFNNNFKITPPTFDGWMRILARVPGSVLWLLGDGDSAARNLRKEAAKRGIDPGRLVFARRMPAAEHLARHRAADLMLDTLPYNAHTTSSDALWTGLPVLTLLGEAFAGRVAASLLNAVGLPELVTTSQESYETLAVELATNSGRLAELRGKLASNRLSSPLFDSTRYARHLEALYETMYARREAGLVPEHIHVAKGV